MAKAIDVFSEWAKEGRSEKMADGHALAVDNMLVMRSVRVMDRLLLTPVAEMAGWFENAFSSEM